MKYQYELTQKDLLIELVKYKEIVNKHKALTKAEKVKYKEVINSNKFHTFDF